MSRSKVFISYSHEDRRVLQRLRKQLGVLEAEGLVEAFEDSQISVGEPWQERLEREMSEANLAILLVSAPFLTSPFIRTKEVPSLFARHAADGMILYPLLVGPCVWEEVSWLSRLQMRPNPLRAVAELRGAAAKDACLAQVAREVAKLLSKDGHAEESEMDALRKLYPGIEQLIAVYSLMCWRAGTQQPPVIEAGGAESGTYPVSCDDIAWGTEETTRPGALFDCFSRKVKQRYDNFEFMGYYIAPNEDFWYSFTWESLFGYELEVFISPEPRRHQTAYALRDHVATHNRNIIHEELGDRGREFPTIPLYVVNISGLSASNELTFIASGGYVAQNGDGSIDHVDEWVVYLGDDHFVRLPAIRKTIQLVLRKLRLDDRLLPQVVPKLETIWMQAAGKTLTTIVDELRGSGEFLEIAAFLDQT